MSDKNIDLFHDIQMFWHVPVYVYIYIYIYVCVCRYYMLYYIIIF